MGSRRRKEGTHALALALAVGLSIVMHMAFVPILVTVALRGSGDRTYEIIEFEGLPRDLDWSEQDPPEPDYDPDEDLPDRQVVDSPVPDPEDRDEDTERKADYVSDKTVRVKSQMKSDAHLKGDYQVGSETAGPEELSGPDMPGIYAETEEAGQDFEPAEEGTVLLGEEPYEYKGDSEKPPVTLMPSFASVSGAVKGSGIDSLEKVEEGPKSLLDTDEWKHAGFFNRVKNAVAQYWQPGLAYSIHDPTGRVFGYKDRETIVKVVLDCEGELLHTYVNQPSGADFLDDVAVGAIKKASPFPNPPKALCDVEEQIIAFRFGFLVKVGDSSIIKVKKY